MTPYLLKLELYNILKITNEDVYIDFPLCFPCIFEEPSNGYNFCNISGIGLIDSFQSLRLSYILNQKIFFHFTKILNFLFHIKEETLVVQCRTVMRLF